MISLTLQINNIISEHFKVNCEWSTIMRVFKHEEIIDIIDIIVLSKMHEIKKRHYETLKEAFSFIETKVD